MLRRSSRSGDHFDFPGIGSSREYNRRYHIRAKHDRGDKCPYNSLALSPDATRAAVERRESTSAGSDLWLIETVSGGKSERFTFDPGSETTPVWSADGSRIVYGSSHDGAINLYQKLSNGAGNEEPLFKSAEAKYPNDWSRVGHTLIYTAVASKTSNDVMSLSLEGEFKPSVFLNSEFYEARGKLSPDGQWIAY